MHFGPKSASANTLSLSIQLGSASILNPEMIFVSLDSRTMGSSGWHAIFFFIAAVCRKSMKNLRQAKTIIIIVKYTDSIIPHLFRSCRELCFIFPPRISGDHIVYLYLSMYVLLPWTRAPPIASDKNRKLRLFLNCLTPVY